MAFNITTQSSSDYINNNYDNYKQFRAFHDATVVFPSTKTSF